MSRLSAVLTSAILLTGLRAGATPFFARQYHMHCVSCHEGFPRLNAFGLAFKANNFRIPGAEKDAVMAWQKSVPLAAQVVPVYQRYRPPFTLQYTDTQLLAGGLLSHRTAFYIHHTLFFDGQPQPFPSWEAWAQQVVDEKHAIMLKAGQFELPWAYSPEINRTTISTPLLFFSATLDPNDVTLGDTVTGLQMSARPQGRLRLYLEGGEPGSAASGNLVGERQFFGRFRDVFVKLESGEAGKNVGLFAYFTHPPRKRADPNTEERGIRYGLDGSFHWRGYQAQGMLVYGENSDPAGLGKAGFVRGGLLEVDRMFLRNAGATVRLDLVDKSFNGKSVYMDAKTIAVRYYPFEHLRLIAEQQWMDHGQSVTSIGASIAF